MNMSIIMPKGRKIVSSNLLSCDLLISPAFRAIDQSQWLHVYPRRCASDQIRIDFRFFQAALVNDVVDLALKPVHFVGHHGVFGVELHLEAVRLPTAAFLCRLEFPRTRR